MSKLILTNRKTFPSAKNLRDEMEIIFGEKFLVTKKENKKNYFLRYGNSFGNFSGEVNSPNIIEMMADKKKFSTFLLNSGLLTPKFHQNIDEIYFPCLIRESLTSSGGIGIHVIENEEKFFNFWGENFYWTEFIDFKYELRAHVLGGEMEKLFIKKWMLEEVPKYPIKNSSSCRYILQDISNKDRYKKLRNIISVLKELLGENNFYALDIGYNEDEKDYYIIEGNSAPGLNKETAKNYAKFLRNIL